MKKLIPILAISLILSACVTYRPQNDADYEKAVTALIDKKSEIIKFNDHAVWYPNRSTIPSAYTFPSTIEGNIVITNKNLYFLEWDKNANTYNIVKKLTIQNIESVKIVSSGLYEQFVIQSKNHNFDLFSVVSDIGRIQSDKNKELSDYINSLIKKSPVAPERH